MLSNNNGYARTPYASDAWWFRFCKDRLRGRLNQWITDIDLIRYRPQGDTIEFCIVESKCLEGRRMKQHQKITFTILDQLLKYACSYDGPIEFKAHGHLFRYKMEYTGFFLCNSFACDMDCNDLLDIQERPTTDRTGLLTTNNCNEATIDAIIRDRGNNFMFLLRRFRGAKVDMETAIIVRAIDALLNRFYSESTDSTGVITTHSHTGKNVMINNARYHGANLLEYDREEIADGSLWWNGKRSDLTKVVNKMTFGKPPQ